MQLCPYCDSDDIALQEAERVDTKETAQYNFLVWICSFFCRTCGNSFNCELDDDERNYFI